jgi:hypothetical protein
MSEISFVHGGLINGCAPAPVNRLAFGQQERPPEPGITALRWTGFGDIGSLSYNRPTIESKCWVAPVNTGYHDPKPPMIRGVDWTI